MERFELLFSLCDACDKLLTADAGHHHDCRLWERIDSYIDPIAEYPTATGISK
jgi:hypothetical protein